MHRKSRYVFGVALAAALGGVPGVVGRAHAAQVTNADFTFEKNLSQILGPGEVVGSGTATSIFYTDTHTTFVGPMSADIGTGSFYGANTATQTSLATDFLSRTGNGSFHSFAANGWNPGNYYRFDVPTTGISAILFSFNQVSYGSGPQQFSLEYSVDGTNFSTFTTYAVGSSSAFPWNSSSSATATNQVFSFDLSGITGLNNDSHAQFRLVDADGSAASTSGENWIDNVVVSGTAIPEPAILGPMLIAAAALIRRRGGGRD